MTDITVFMCTRNAEKYIGEAIESILSQSYTDFELLIVDDNSTDNTPLIISQYADNRVRYLRNTSGYIASLNLGLTEAQSKYIARMDADDIMHPDRLRIQHEVMETESDIDICSCLVQRFGLQSPHPVMLPEELTGMIRHPLRKMLRGNFIHHSSVMLRKSFLQQTGLTYRNDYPYAEDYKFWAESCLNGGTLYIEPQILMYYQISDTQISRHKQAEQKTSAQKIQDEIALALIHTDKNSPTLLPLYTLMKQVLRKRGMSLAPALQWIDTVLLH